MSEVVTLTVPGKCEPRGSKIAVPLYDKVKDAAGNVVNPNTGKPVFKPRLDKHGRVMTYIRDDNPASGPWMKKIARAAQDIMGDRPPVRCAVKLYLRFYLERPQFHFGTGKNAGVLKERFAHARPIVRPDRLKLARAIEDAITGILVADDAQTVGGDCEKFYVAPGEQPRVEIEMHLPSVRQTVQQILLDQSISF